MLDRPLMPISLAFFTRSALDQSLYDPPLPPFAATLLRPRPAEALAIRADFSLLSPCSRSFWYCFSSLIWALGMGSPPPVTCACATQRTGNQSTAART